MFTFLASEPRCGYGSSTPEQEMLRRHYTNMSSICVPETRALKASFAQLHQSNSVYYV